MQLKHTEKTDLQTILSDLTKTAEARSMRRYVQHGSVSTYDHCIRVAQMSYLINRRLHIHSDERSLVRGAFLHDFYLYDWHDHLESTRWHGFRHPAKALANAERCFSVNPIERNIIITHMWPLTLRAVPRCREAVIVCVADKLCGLQETLLLRTPKK